MSDSADRESSEEDRDRLIESFVQITGSDAQRARDNLEWSMWDLAVALERYYGRMEMRDMATDPSEDVMMEDDVAVEPQHIPEIRRKREEKSKFGTIADLKSGEGSDTSDDDEGQAYYAGGSEHSGQQVLGPPSRKKKKDIIADILKSVQQIGAEVIEEGKPSSSLSKERFSGTGYRLGQTETDSQVIPSTSSPTDESAVVTLKLWKEGFNVNDGPLRQYDDPKNKQFLDSVRQGVVPPELTGEFGNAVVQLNLEDRHHETYMQAPTPKMKPFSGQGHVLGRPTPPVANKNLDEGHHPTDAGLPSAPFKLDDSKPKTTIAIRLPDGSRLKATFNHNHTIADIRVFINETYPEYAAQPYSLQTTIPVLELEDYSVTVEDAGLINSVLIMKLKK